MKKRIIALSLFAMLVSCGDKETVGEEVDGILVPGVVTDAFNSKFAGATLLSWEAKEEYYVAKFKRATKADDGDGVAWFEADGEWRMTEENLASNELPQAVSSAIAGSEYADWKIDDIDKLDRNSVDVVYVVEMEQGDNEVDLYISETGVIVKSVIEPADDEDYDDYIPENTDNTITSKIKELYPNAKIVDIENEDDGVEVEIVDGDVKREVLLSNSGEWIITQTDIEFGDMPQAAQGIIKEKYADYEVDDVEQFDNAEGTYYIVELDSDNDDIDIKVDVDGSVSEVVEDDDDDDDNNDNDDDDKVSADIKTFIENRYSGAKIDEVDNDNGYTVVEFKHNSIDKEARFNGKNEWVETTWDIKTDALDSSIKDNIATNHPGYEIDDVDYVETESRSYFRIELENDDTDDEKVVEIDDTTV